MAKIKIEVIEGVENLDEPEQRQVRGAGFEAWLKSRSADSSQAEDWDDELEDRDTAKADAPDAKAKPTRAS